MKERQRVAKYQFKKSRKNAVITISLAVVVILALVGVRTYDKLQYYDRAADQANLVSVREMILLAVRGVKKDAPVDAKTGDVYFPESQLYLTNPGTALALTYLYDKGNIADSQGELSVSTYPVRGTEALYTAQDNQELFAAIPKLQACSRGIKVVHNKYPADDTQNVLKHELTLKSGQHLYIYLEKDCPELSDTADLFQHIQAY